MTSGAAPVLYNSTSAFLLVGRAKVVPFAPIQPSVTALTVIPSRLHHLSLSLGVHFCRDSSVVLYAVESASQVSHLRACHDDGVSCMALFEPRDGAAAGAQQLLVTGAWDATVKVRL